MVNGTNSRVGASIDPFLGEKFLRRINQIFYFNVHRCCQHFVLLLRIVFSNFYIQYKTKKNVTIYTYFVIYNVMHLNSGWKKMVREKPGRGEIWIPLLWMLRLSAWTTRVGRSTGEQAMIREFCFHWSNIYIHKTPTKHNFFYVNWCIKYANR